MTESLKLKKQPSKSEFPKDGSSNNFFFIMSQLVSDEHKQKIYVIWKSLRKQKNEKIIQFINLEQNINIKPQINALLSKEYKNYTSEDIQTILKTWFFLYFIKEDSWKERLNSIKNQVKNTNYFEFLEEISLITNQSIYYLEHDEFNVIKANSMIKSIIYYENKENKYYFKKNVDNAFIEKFKKIDDKKKICNICKKLCASLDSHAIFYEKCKHFFCGDCAGKGKERSFCKFCIALIEENKDLCTVCKISYNSEILLKCKKCNEFFCRVCFLENFNENKKNCHFCDK